MGGFEKYKGLKEKKLYTISIYIWGPISRSQGPKAGISQRADSAKNAFGLGPVSESTFGRLQDTRKRVLGAFGTAFGVFWQVLGIAQTCDSVQYILKKSAFQRFPVPTCFSMARLKRSGAFGGVQSSFLGPFGYPFWHVEWGT